VRTEIQIGGFGGQGIVLAGVILGEAVIRDGKNAVQAQSYGPESRGGAARSDVIISDAPIDYPKVIAPDLLVALSPPAYEKYRGLVKKKGIIIIDSDLVETADQDVRRFPFASMADDLGRRVVANIIMLGVLARISGCVTDESLRQSVLKNIPRGTGELNTRALEAGFGAA
jgi:2-oxoglutarate ferredoxin oxidoreductase subunit gamma